MAESSASARTLRAFTLCSLFALCALIFLAAGPVYAGKVINLNTDQEYTGTGALQNAIDDANSGDTLFIKGTLIGYSTITKSLTLLGEEFGAILDGNLAGRVLELSEAIEVTIKNLTIQNGRAAGLGGGIYSHDGVDLTIKDTEISNNSSTTGSGGGIYSFNANLLLDEVKLYYNSAKDNGGGLYFEDGNVGFIDTKVKYNQATSGGGMYFSGDPSSVHGFSAAIAFNTASGSGGGIRNTGNFTLTIEGIAIYSNQAADGGGISNDNEAHITIIDCLLEDNTATNRGGGLYNWNDGVATLNGSTIIHNTADTGGGIYNDNTGQLTLNDTVVKHNTPDDIKDL